MKGYVYLLKTELDGKYVYKVGYSKNNPLKRIKQLQTGSPNEISIESFYESIHARKIETVIHRLKKPNRIMGEWFMFNENEVSEFKTLCSTIDLNMMLIN